MDEKLWKKCTEYHGHACPGLAIGVRATLLAQEALGVSFPAEGLRCTAAKSMCGCDGVRCITGCTEENGLFSAEGGETIAFAFRLPDGRGVRVEYTGEAKQGDKSDKAARIKQILEGEREGQFSVSPI